MALSVLVLVALLAGCGDDGGGKTASGNKKDDPSVMIRQPKQDATAECPVVLRVKGRKLKLLGGEAEPATGEETPDRVSARIHGLVDRAAPAAGATVPKADGSTVVDFNQGRASVAKLPAGEHEVIVIAATENRKVLTPVIKDQVAFKVEAC
ncbi:MAG: hypothetical protein WKF43_05805 [Acidimicrobiales bacterium]